MSSSQQCITIKIPTHLHLLLFKLLTATSLNMALYYNGCSARKSNRRGQKDKITRKCEHVIKGKKICNTLGSLLLSSQY